MHVDIAEAFSHVFSVVRQSKSLFEATEGRACLTTVQIPNKLDYDVTLRFPIECEGHAAVRKNKEGIIESASSRPIGVNKQIQAMKDLLASFVEGEEPGIFCAFSVMPENYGV
jgi:hypothetical protein